MKILMTAFRNTSAQKLISHCIADTLIIENDKKKCAEQIGNAVFSLVFALTSRNKGNFYAPLTTLFSCLVELRFASLVA